MGTKTSAFRQMYLYLMKDNLNNLNTLCCSNRYVKYCTKPYSDRYEVAFQGDYLKQFEKWQCLIQVLDVAYDFCTDCYSLKIDCDIYYHIWNTHVEVK